MSTVDKGQTVHWQSGDDAVNRLREFTIEEVSLVDRPANKRPFLVRKQEDSMSGKTKVGAALKSMSVALEKTSALVEALKGDVAGPKLIELTTTAQLLGKDLKDISVDYSTFKFEGEAVVASGEVTKINALKSSTDALERMTAVVTTLKGAEEIEDEAFTAVAQEIATISNLLSQIGAPVVAAKTEETPVVETVVPAEAVATPAAEAAPAPVAVEAAAPAEAAPEATPAVEAAAPAAPTTEQIVEAVESAATAAEGAAVGEVTKAAITRVGKMLDNAYLYGSLSIDSYDVESLKQIVDALVSVLGGDAPVAKRVGAVMKGVASELRAVAKAVKDASKLDVVLAKRVVTMKTLVTKVAESCPAEETVAPAPMLPGNTSMDVAAMRQMIEESVSAAVTKAEIAKAEAAKLTAENEKLRAELAKRDAEPTTTRGSSPEPTVNVDKGTGAEKLFPANYNAPPVD